MDLLFIMTLHTLILFHKLDIGLIGLNYWNSFWIEIKSTRVANNSNSSGFGASPANLSALLKEKKEKLWLDFWQKKDFAIATTDKE